MADVTIIATPTQATDVFEHQGVKFRIEPFAGGFSISSCTRLIVDQDTPARRIEAAELLLAITDVRADGPYRQLLRQLTKAPVTTNAPVPEPDLHDLARHINHEHDPA